jgi:hypothetical protein
MHTIGLAVLAASNKVPRSYPKVPSKGLQATKSHPKDASPPTPPPAATTTTTTTTTTYPITVTSTATATYTITTTSTENMSEGARYNVLQFQEAHKYVFRTKVARGEVGMTEATIRQASKQCALELHPDKGGTAAGFAEMTAYTKILFHISKVGLRLYNYSELKWAKDQLGFAASNYSVVPTEDKVKRAYLTKMKGVWKGLAGNNNVRCDWIYKVAYHVLRDIAEAGVSNIVLDPFDPRQSFPSQCFE